jgi:hypothetical protein
MQQALSEKQTISKMITGLSQVVESLSSKYESLSSTLSNKEKHKTSIFV